LAHKNIHLENIEKEEEDDDDDDDIA